MGARKTDDGRGMSHDLIRYPSYHQGTRPHTYTASHRPFCAFIPIHTRHSLSPFSVWTSPLLVLPPRPSRGLFSLSLPSLSSLRFRSLDFLGIPRLSVSSRTSFMTSIHPPIHSSHISHLTSHLTSHLVPTYLSRLHQSHVSHLTPTIRSSSALSHSHYHSRWHSHCQPV